MNVLVKTKELANGLKAILLTIGEQEGMLLPDLAKLLGVVQSNLQHIAKRHGLLIVTPSVDQILDMRRQDVISMKTRRVNFLPQATVEALVKLVDTPAAWSIYGQLWDVAKAVHTGSVMDLGFVLDTQSLINQFEGALNLAKRLQADLNTANTKIVHAESYAADHAEQYGLTSAMIIERWPEQAYKLIEAKRPEIRDPAKFGDSGILTIALRDHDICPSLTRFTKKGPARLFNAKEVEDFMVKMEQTT